MKRGVSESGAWVPKGVIRWFWKEESGEEDEERTRPRPRRRRRRWRKRNEEMRRPRRPRMRNVRPMARPVEDILYEGLVSP